ncbi:MAG: 16S rRNA (guanine(527)-N(7))-methyltransferase RsmG [Thiotrichaceae bacterium]
MSKINLEAGLQSLNCPMDEGQIIRLQTYVDMLLRWNKVYNLTAIRNVDDVLPLHIFDSLAVAPFIKGKQFLDVGSGGGLPGIPLAICFPERQFTLLDTVGKKTRFMQQAAIELKLPNVSVVQTRVESWSSDIVFDAIISRAFSSLNDFVSLTAQHMHKQGSLYAMKGRYPKDELAQLPNGYHVVAEHKLAVPQLDAERYLIEIKHTEI